MEWPNLATLPFDPPVYLRQTLSLFGGTWRKAEAFPSFANAHDHRPFPGADLGSRANASGRGPAGAPDAPPASASRERLPARACRKGRSSCRRHYKRRPLRRRGPG